MDENKDISRSRVMIAGHICLDITPVLQMEAVTDIGEILAPGKLLHAGRADLHTGGAVSNTGLAMKKLGANVKLAAKAGNDSFGHVAREKLDEYGCGGDLIIDAASTTSYSVVLAFPGVDRIFLHHPGANDSFCSSDISDDMLADIKHFHFGYPPLMRRIYENGGSELLSLFKRVKAFGISTSLDMAAVDENSPAAGVDWQGLLQKLLPYVDFFLPSVEELCFMVDRPRYKDWSWRARGMDIIEILDVENDVAPLSYKLMEMGAKVLIIKCGSLGMYYSSASEQELADIIDLHSLNSDAWQCKTGFIKSFFQPDIVSATGAGDASIAAFLCSMLEGGSFERCVKLAAATGACCLSAYDAISGLQPLDALWERICRGWSKGSE